MTGDAVVAVDENNLGAGAAADAGDAWAALASALAALAQAVVALKAVAALVERDVWALQVLEEMSQLYCVHEFEAAIVVVAEWVPVPAIAKTQQAAAATAAAAKAAPHQLAPSGLACWHQHCAFRAQSLRRTRHLMT